MKRIRIGSEVNLETGINTDTDVFVHGDDLWRLQKTKFEYNNGKKQQFISNEHLDFSKSDFEKFFPALFLKIGQVLKSGVQRGMLEYTEPYAKDLQE